MKALERLRDGVINLGYANGWTRDMRDEFRDLESIRVPDSLFSENIGNCDNKYTFDIKVHDNVYKVIYFIDSSD